MTTIHTSIRKLVVGWIFFFLLATGLEVIAAGEIILNASGNNSIRIIEYKYSLLRISNNISSLTPQLLKTDQGEFVELLINSYSKSNTIGSPQLPVLSKLIEIPEGSIPEVKVISYELKEYKLEDFGVTQRLIPVQAPQSKNKNINQNIAIAFNRKVYETNSYYGEALVRVEVAGYLRGVHLASLILSPVAYNPVTNTIRVYDNLVVEINFTGTHNLKTVENKSKTESPYFNNVLRNVLNFQPDDTKAEAINGIPVKYVIVSDPMFQNALQPFVKWKTKCGFRVIEAYTNNPLVGSSLTSIKAYLQNLYSSATTTDPAPTFVLFVGDVAQIPSFHCGDHVSDLYYCEYTGDYLPEVFYGRFSANTVAELLPQIDKTLQYEQYLMPDPSYLNEVVLVAGADASHQMKWGNGPVNYLTTYYFNEAHHLEPHIYLQPEPVGGNYSKNIRDNISNGVSIASYSAHGSAEGWADPTFTIADVAKLQNSGKYGLMVGNSCQTNAFDQNSFGEALLRAENKGAVGYIGASGLTYWDEDYWWGVGNGSIVSNPTYENSGPGAYDRIFHDHGELRSGWFSTMGQMVFAGNLAVQESNSEMKKQYWESYCLMGDPSTMIYFGVPPALSINYNSLLPLKASNFEVQTEPFASVAISKDNILHGVTEADENGLAVISLQPFSESGYADIVVTMQNRKPYIGSVKVASPEGPYLALNKVVIRDYEGNNNSLPEYGESLTLDISLDNLGNSGAIKANSILSTTDKYFTIPDNSHIWPSITGNGSVSATNAFTLKVSDDVPDQHMASFTITTQTDSGIFNSQFYIRVSAPMLINGSTNFDELTVGKGNGKIDPGETIILNVPTTNTGHALSGEVITQLFVFGDYVTTNSQSINLGKLAPGETGYSTFTFTVSPDAKPGSSLSLYIVATAGMYNSVSGLFPAVGSLLEDFETNDFLKYNWQFKGIKPWEISSIEKSEGAFGAKSGAIHDSERSEMYLEAQFLLSDSISFYRKVSSETGYDFLKFIADGLELGSWSGNKGWEKVSYPVSAGKHTFSWVYEKDEATSAGLDAAWIDYIQFPAFNQVKTGMLKVNTLALPDTICAGEQSQLYAFASGGKDSYCYSWTLADKLPFSGNFNPLASPDQTMIYNVSVTSGSLSVNENITVNVEQSVANPVITVLEDHLISSAITGNQWYNSQGPIPGATDQKYFPTATDSYYVINNAKACPSFASNEVEFGFTDIKPPVKNGVSVYPNPFNSNLVLDFTLKSGGHVKILIYNTSGIEVKTIELGEKAAGNYKVVFDGSKLTPGIFTCKIYSGNSVQLVRVIKN